MKRGPSEGTFRKQEGLVTRRIAGETIIVPIRSGVGDLDSIYTLNEVGTRIWGLLDGGEPVPAMARKLAEEFEVLPQDAERDIGAFLESLLEAGLVRPAPALAE